MMPARKPDDVGKRVRRFSPKRLHERPVKIPTCQGEVVVSAETVDGRLQVRIEQKPVERKDEPCA